MLKAGDEGIEFWRADSRASRRDAVRVFAVFLVLLSIASLPMVCQLDTLEQCHMASPSGQ